jgi:hypothetical protein
MQYLPNTFKYPFSEYIIKLIKILIAPKRYKKLWMMRVTPTD